MIIEMLSLKLTIWLRCIDDALYSAFQPGTCANTAGPCELDKTFHPVHNRNKSRRSTGVTACPNNL